MYEDMFDLILDSVSSENGSTFQRLSAANLCYGEHGIHLSFQSQTTLSSIYTSTRSHAI